MYFLKAAQSMSSLKTRTMLHSPLVAHAACCCAPHRRHKTVINWCHIIELTGLIFKQKFVNI